MGHAEILADIVKSKTRAESDLDGRWPTFPISSAARQSGNMNSHNPPGTRMYRGTDFQEPWFAGMPQ